MARVSQRLQAHLVGIANDHTANWRALQALCRQQIGFRVWPASVNVFCSDYSLQGRPETCGIQHRQYPGLWCRAGYRNWHLHSGREGAQEGDRDRVEVRPRLGKEHVM